MKSMNPQNHHPDVIEIELLEIEVNGGEPVKAMLERNIHNHFIDEAILPDEIKNSALESMRVTGKNGMPTYINACTFPVKIGADSYHLRFAVLPMMERNLGFKVILSRDQMDTYNLKHQYTTDKVHV